MNDKSPKDSGSRLSVVKEKDDEKSPTPPSATNEAKRRTLSS